MFISIELHIFVSMNVFEEDKRFNALTLSLRVLSPNFVERISHNQQTNIACHSRIVV
jgi:hypothetical protein